MEDDELFELVRTNYAKANQDYIKNQIRIAKEVSCSGCRHLFYYNDGSVGCDLNAERACFSSNRKYYEVKEN